jgi:hypothetical protein
MPETLGSIPSTEKGKKKKKDLILATQTKWANFILFSLRHGLTI